mgnify:FL=1
MKKIIAIAAAMLAFAAVASANNYVANDAAIDAIVAEATVESAASMAVAGPGQQLIADGSTCELVAFLLEFTGIGAGIGLHRLVLGTKPINMLWYFLTFGGIFGIVPIVDGVLLLIDLIQGQTSWLNNPAFIMWL